MNCIVTAALLAGSVVTFAATSKADNTGKTDNAQRYKIEGEILLHRPSHDFITSQEPSYDEVRNFTLTVNGRNSAIHVEGPSLEKGGIKYDEVVTLNGSVYSYWYAGELALKGGVNRGGAVIKYGDVPIEDGAYASFIWVGLASADYFARATNGKLVSLWSGPRDAMPLKVNADWRLSDQPPYLPKSIEYYHGAEPYMRPPFVNGWKETQVSILEETNIGGESFPLVYTCEQFWPKQTGAVTSNDLEVADSLTIRVHSIQLDSVPDVLPPKTEGVTAVGEARFPNNTGNKQIVYFPTLDRLPEKPEAAIIQEYNQKQKQAASHTTAGRRRLDLARPSNRKWIWLSVILIISAIAVIAGLIKRKRRI
jgi:hypothetical protein